MAGLWGLLVTRVARPPAPEAAAMAISQGEGGTACSERADTIVAPTTPQPRIPEKDRPGVWNYWITHR